MRVSIALAALLAASRPAAAQQPEAVAQPPVFGVGVDVVAVDASVVDAEGRPVLGLGPEDFRVQVDGKPRRLVSVEYVGRDLEPAAPPRARPAHFSSNEGAPGGRLVLLLVDRGNIGRGKGREVLKGAERFLDTLAPGDRVGLAFVPGPGAGIEFTPEVEDVRRGLKGVVGQADRSGFRVPLAEAVSHIQLNDRRRWEEFLLEQCGGYMSETREYTSPDRPIAFAQARMEQCNLDLQNEAALVYRLYRERSLATQSALRATFRSLERIEGPKTLVFISEGLGTESPGELRDLGIAASRARVTLFVVLLDTSSADASFNYSAIATMEDREVESGGLYDLATQARGAVLRVTGSGETAFQRIAREMMGYYLLGFEPEAGDRDGGSHQIKVAVSRSEATVRARGLLSIPAAPPTPKELLAAALRSPLLDSGLPVRLTAYTLTDAAAGKVRVLMAARVGGSTRPLSVGFALADAAGKVAASRAYEGIAGGEGEWVEFTAEAVVDPATYNLRLAAVDAVGRRGSVEHTVKAALLSAGGLEISDLVLAPSSAGAAVRPAVDLELAGGGLSALLELASRDPARLARASVAFELAESAEGRALLRAPVEAGAPGKDGTRVARVEIAAGLLPPGDYAARAEVSVEGKPVAVVTRPFRIAPPRAGAAIPRAPLAGLLVETRPFDRAELLKPDTLGHFLDRLERARPGPRAREGGLRDRGGAAGPARGHGGPSRRGREGRRPHGLPARRVVLREWQHARRPDAAPGGVAARLGALPGGGLHGRLLRRGGQGPRRDRGLADRPHRRGGQPRALRAPQRRARPGEGAGAGAGDPERGPRRVPRRRRPSPAARHGLRDGRPGRGGPPAAHRVGGRPPGGPAGPLRHAGPALRGILARDGGSGGRRRNGSASRATRRPTWTARARTAR